MKVLLEGYIGNSISKKKLKELLSVDPVLFVEAVRYPHLQEPKSSKIKTEGPKEKYERTPYLVNIPLFVRKQGSLSLEGKKFAEILRDTVADQLDAVSIKNDMYKDASKDSFDFMLGWKKNYGIFWENPPGYIGLFSGKTDSLYSSFDNLYKYLLKIYPRIIMEACMADILIGDSTSQIIEHYSRYYSNGG